MNADLVNDQPARPWVLMAAGVNLILAQYWTMREYQVILSRSEVSILLVTTAFFASCSVGYRLAPRRFRRVSAALCAVLFVVHLFFPWLIKEMAATFYRHDLPHVTVALLGVGVLVMAPLSTILLPHLIQAREVESGQVAGGHALTLCYGLELAGALLGVAAILTVGRLGLSLLLVLYFLNASLILAFIFGTKTILWGAAPISLAYGLLYGPLDRRAVVDLYEALGYAKGTIVLATRQSLYNRIDALEGPGGAKYLLLNGGMMFNPTSLEAFNRYLAGLPSALMPGSRVLIVGTGTLSSLYHASRHAATVESVEIDRQVVEVTTTLFREFNHVDEVPNWILHVDDAKHFLGATDRQYDLIVIDLVPPYYVQTALLHTREFYELVKQRLSPHGVLAIYTGHWFTPSPGWRDGFVPERTIDAVFPEYLVVNSRAAGMAFVYASTGLPFGKQEVRAWFEAAGTADADEVFDATEVRPAIQTQRVASMDNLDLVLEWSPSSYRSLVHFLGGRW